MVAHRTPGTSISDIRKACGLPADVPGRKAERVVAEVSAVAVALSDDIFLAEHLEPDTTDVARMYLTITALIPILLEEK